MKNRPLQRVGQPDRTFLESLARVGGGRVLLVGDFMLDETVRGAAERLSPDAPVPVLTVNDQDESIERCPGGAGNVAACLRGLEIEVDLVGPVGADDAAAHVRTALQELGCGVEGLIEDPTRPTTVKRSLLGLAQHRHPQKMFRLDIESNRGVGPEAANAMLAAIDEALPKADVVCLEDYAKGACSAEFCQELLKRCTAAGVPLLVDPAAIDDYSRYKGATAITPNRSEAERASGTDGALQADLNTAVALADGLRNDYGFERVILTLDRDGALLVDNSDVQHLPTDAREVYDVTGAGDMVLAGLAAGLASGLDWLTSVRLANLAAGLVVEQVGAGAVPLANVRREGLRMCKGEGGKTRTLDQLLIELEILRMDGRRIVLTNGCFDVIHAGHVAYLKEARQQGDVLVVGVNADKQVRALKGDDRPIFSEQERLEILEEFASVDYLVVFQEPTADALISAVAPDVYVKGGDYSPEEIAECDLLGSLGIEVRVLAERPGLGSSAVIERIRAIDHR